MSEAPEAPEVDEDEDDENEEPEPAPEPPPRKGRPPRGVGRPPRGVAAQARPAPGVGAPPPADDRPDSHDVEVIWPWVIRKLKALGLTPYDCDIQVKRIEPNESMLPPSINGAAVMGTDRESPVDALLRVIDDSYHLPNARTPASYILMFINKRTAYPITRARVLRPAPEEIDRLRAAQYRQPPLPRRGAPSGYGGPPEPPEPQPQPYAYDQWGRPQPPPPPVGWGPPPYDAYAYDQWGRPRPGAYPPPYGAPQPGYGAPYQPAPQAPPQPDQATLAYQQHLAAQNAMLIEILTKNGVGVPAGLAAPPPPPPAPAAMVMPARQAHGALGELEQLVKTMEGLKTLGKSIGRVFGDDDDEPAPLPAVVEPPKPEDGLPFELITIPGTNMKYAKNRETGSIDVVGTGLGNLDSDVGRKLVSAVQDGLAILAKNAGLKTDGSIEAVQDTKTLPAHANGTSEPVQVWPKT